VAIERRELRRDRGRVRPGQPERDVAGLQPRVHPREVIERLVEIGRTPGLARERERGHRDPLAQHPLTPCEVHHPRIRGHGADHVLHHELAHARQQRDGPQHQHPPRAQGPPEAT
jgi:hypothetical protein